MKYETSIAAKPKRRSPPCFTFPSPYILQTLSNQTIVMSTNSQANVSVMISADSRDTVEDNDASPPPPVVQGGGTDRPLSPQGLRRPETYLMLQQQPQHEPSVDVTALAPQHLTSPSDRRHPRHEINSINKHLLSYITRNGTPFTFVRVSATGSLIDPLNHDNLSEPRHWSKSHFLKVIGDALGIVIQCVVRLTGCAP
jgi:hypothetical protein